MSKLRFVLVLYLLSPLCLVATDKSDSSSPQLLISTAIDHSDLWKASAPMTLRGTIELVQRGRTASGTYQLAFGSNARWREDVRFANFSRTRIGIGGEYSQSMPVNYQPVFMFWLDRMIHLQRALSSSPKDAFGKVREIRKNDIRVRCSEVRAQVRIFDRTICFDSATGTLVEIDYPTPKNSNPPEIDRIQYSDFRKQGDKLIPFHIESSKSGKPIMTLQITEISADSQSDSLTSIDIPSGSTLWSTCGADKTPELATKIFPQYPSQARVSRQSGNVILYGIIEADGRLSNLRVLHSASTLLDAAAMDAVRQWRYESVLCDGTAVRVETLIEVNFSLRE